MEDMVKNMFPLKGKTIFITGANGFLGSHLVKHSLELKARVICLIKEDIHGSLFCVFGLEKKCRVIKGDLSDEKLIEHLFRQKRIDICFHVGAQAIVTIANSSPIDTFKANIQGTWNILEAARKFKAGAVVVASSDKAYGEHKKLPYSEDAALLALHPYDASKACADILARAYAHTYNLPVAVTRCANIFGPGDLNFSRIIPDTMRAAIYGRNPVIRSDGTPVRDYIYIDDVVRGYFLLAAKLSAGKIQVGEAFNFGQNEPVNVLKLVKLILKLAGDKRLKPEIRGRGKPKGEIDRQYLCSDKAKRILSWQPNFSLKDGLEKTYQWYKDNSLI